MALEQIVDEVAQHAIGPTCSAIDDTTKQNAGVRIPLNVQSSPAVDSSAVYLCPPMLAAWLVLFVIDQIEVSQFGIVRDSVAKAPTFGAHDLDESLHWRHHAHRLARVPSQRQRVRRSYPFLSFSLILRVSNCCASATERNRYSRVCT
jgi:hypothetical protein